MINGRKVIAVVTARSGSKGLPNKNIRSFAGKPLLAWPILCATGCRYIDRVILSTDDRGYAEIGEEYGAEVPFLRPARLARDKTPTFDVLADLLASDGVKDQGYSYLVLLEPTAPLTESCDLDAAIRWLDDQRDGCDAVVALRQLYAEHPEFCVTTGARGAIVPYLPKQGIAAVRRQELSPVYAPAGGFYISKVDALLQNKGFYHERTLGHVMPDWKAKEIDTLADFICAEALKNNWKLFSGPEGE